MPRADVDLRPDVFADARLRLDAIASITLGHFPTPIEPLLRLAAAIGTGARLYAKRDDAIPFGFGGNKVRKLGIVAAQAVAAGADTLITCGGVQSNHARATAAAAAKLGMRCILIANGEPQDRPTANALLDRLLGAEIRHVATRDERNPGMRAAAAEVRRDGGTPFEIPLGASTPEGALGFVRGIDEMVAQGFVPDVIVHASSSGGTQAGLVAGCALQGLRTRVIGISADDPVESLRAIVTTLVNGIESLAGLSSGSLDAIAQFAADASFVGEGYGIPTTASREAQSLAARTEAIFVDHTYTAKALAALISYVREGRITDGEQVLFWHTGGQVGIFA